MARAVHTTAPDSEQFQNLAQMLKLCPVLLCEVNVGIAQRIRGDSPLRVEESSDVVNSVVPRYELVALHERKRELNNVQVPLLSLPVSPRSPP